MKKVLKVFGAIILCLGVIALIVCMCVIPNETKLFFDRVFEYLDKPFVLCGVSVTIGGILLFFITRYILNNTSVGKKHLKELKELVDKYNEIQNKKDELTNENIYKLGVEYKKMATNITNEIDKLENALKQVPNKKVQEVLNNGEEKDN